MLDGFDNVFRKNRKFYSNLKYIRFRGHMNSNQAVVVFGWKLINSYRNLFCVAFFVHQMLIPLFGEIFDRSLDKVSKISDKHKIVGDVNVDIQLVQPIFENRSRAISNNLNHPCHPEVRKRWLNLYSK